MKYAKKCPTFTIISTASDGDVNAIEKILQLYDSYINKASLRILYDGTGNTLIAVDMELKGLIRAAIIDVILKFEVN